MGDPPAQLFPGAIIAGSKVGFFVDVRLAALGGIKIAQERSEMRSLSSATIASVANIEQVERPARAGIWAFLFLGRAGVYAGCVKPLAIEDLFSYPALRDFLARGCWKAWPIVIAN
jgi:hypothetical protein